jgi:hypothetical protein
LIWFLKSEQRKAKYNYAGRKITQPFAWKFRSEHRHIFPKGIQSLKVQSWWLMRPMIQSAASLAVGLNR